MYAADPTAARAAGTRTTLDQECNLQRSPMDRFDAAIDAFAAQARATYSGEAMTIKIARREGFNGRDFLGAVFYLTQRDITFNDVCRRCS